jgi:hypothetical protein
MSKQTAEKADRERREIEQFVFTFRGAASVSQPQ